MAAPKASAATEEQAVVAEAVKRRFVFAQAVQDTCAQDSVTAYEAEKEFPDTLDDRSDDDMVPDAEAVTLNPTPAGAQSLDRPSCWSSEVCAGGPL